MTNKRKKACLLSALVFPGAGQLYLKLYERAALMLIPAAVCLVYVFSHLLGLANELAYQIQTGAIAPDIISLLAKIREYRQSREGSISGYLSCLFMGIWLFSLIDAWQQGDKQNQAS